VATIHSEVFEAFRSVGIAEDKAVSAAGALARRDSDLATMKADILVSKWMLGFVLAFQVAVIFKLFTH
jgi:hypothetical protein